MPAYTCIYVPASRDFASFSTPCSRDSISTFIRVYDDYEHTHTMFQVDVNKSSILYVPLISYVCPSPTSLSESIPPNY